MDPSGVRVCMNQKIRLLSDEVIGKIAAGEVVERPAAAIKELIENSLDAGADHITVEIRDGGISYFRVTDNGSGIMSSDIRMAFERHATSKIRDAEDLSCIGTLGFRGEALASIAAVSRMKCRTKTATEEMGTYLLCEAGNIMAIEETGCPEGTNMEVRDLFFNTPVRLKFLKKPSSEAAMVSDVIVHAILSRPDVSFRYINQGKTIYHSPGDGKLESAAFCIFGREMLQPTTRAVNGNMNGVVLEGFVGVGESGRGNRNAEYFFINGRCLQSSVLSSGVEEGVRERIMIGKFPMCILHLTMPYESVDVNVHPNKLQVRFQHESEVQEAVACIVKQSLQDRSVFEKPERMQLEESEKNEKPPVHVTIAPQPAAPASAMPSLDQESSSERSISKAIHTDVRRTEVLSGIREPVRPAFSQVASEASKNDMSSQVSSVQEDNREKTTDVQTHFITENDPSDNKKDTVSAEDINFLDSAPKPMRILGAVFHTYILIEYSDQLLLVDQHAAHERLNYESMMKALDTERAGQELLVPMVMHVTSKDMVTLEDNHELLESIGLIADAIGENDIAIRSIPMILGEPQTAQFVRELLDDLGNEPHAFSLQKRRDAILQTACKHSVKGGENLSESDLRYLVEQLIDQHVTPTCPHGRPLVVAISHNELDKKFRRIQP